MDYTCIWLSYAWSWNLGISWYRNQTGMYSYSLWRTLHVILKMSGIAPPVHRTRSLTWIHTLRVHYAHAAANLNSGYSKYAKVGRVHYFCTIALRTSRAVLTRAWASRRVDLRKRRVDLFSKRVITFCW